MYRLRAKEIHAKVIEHARVHYDTIAKIMRGERRPSPELARILEQATGIFRLCWLYPDEFPHPYLKFTPSRRRHTGREKQNSKDLKKLF